MTWRLLDLFSGIGGFSLAAQWVWGDELEIVAFCEIDKFCQKVLKKHWPDVPIIEDVRDVKAETILCNSKGIGLESRCLRPRRICGEMQKGRLSSCPSSTDKIGIDLLTGGFPCQPFSCAGKRKGKEDNRFLWPEMFAVIKEIRPRWVVAENVAGFISMVQFDSFPPLDSKGTACGKIGDVFRRIGRGIADETVESLEEIGYKVQSVIIPACAVNAPHRRDRVWIVANSLNSPDRTNGKQIRKENGLQEINRPPLGSRMFGRTSQDVADKPEQRLEGQISESKFSGKQQGCTPECDWWATEPDVGRVAYGVPSRVDRLKSLGNAIVPQVAHQFFKGIKQIEEGYRTVK